VGIPPLLYTRGYVPLSYTRGYVPLSYTRGLYPSWYTRGLYPSWYTRGREGIMMRIVLSSLPLSLFNRGLWASPASRCYSRFTVGGQLFHHIYASFTSFEHKTHR